MELLGLDAPPVGYLSRFLVGLARAARDKTLERSALEIGGGSGSRDTTALRSLISERIQALPLPI
jgi:hypothetical protein